MAAKNTIDSFVILPWVHPLSHPGETSEPVFEDSSLPPSKQLSPTPHARFSPPPPQGQRKRPQLPLSSSADPGPSFKTRPTICAEDRPHCAEEELFSVAVILDILSTSTRLLSPTPKIFSSLTEVLLMLGELGGITEQEWDSLLATAGGPQGVAREALASALNQHLSSPPLNPPSAAPPHCLDGVATPLGVRHSLEFVEEMATLLIAEARLRIESQQIIEYLQA